MWKVAGILIYVCVVLFLMSSAAGLIIALVLHILLLLVLLGGGYSLLRGKLEDQDEPAERDR